MNQTYAAQLVQAVTQARRRGIMLEGGYKTITVHGARDWHNAAETPLPGELRIVPAANVQGLRYWRHATAAELAAWTADPACTWDQLEQPVLALGSAYKASYVPMVSRGTPWTADRPIYLTTLLAVSGMPNTRLRHILRYTPNAKALCVLPR